VRIGLDDRHARRREGLPACLKREPHRLRGVRITPQAPMQRHFTARFEPL
jgi:hypothetical protein